MDAAVIAGIAACIGALIAWLKARDVARLSQDNEKEVARLRGDLGSTEARLRHDLARDLAMHESSLRVRAEIRLRLFQHAVRSVDRAVRLAHVESGHIANIVIFAHRGKPPPKRQGPPAGTIKRLGVFLPPELDPAFLALCLAIDDASRKAVSAAIGDIMGHDAAVALKTSSEAAQLAVATFEAAAREWKTANWKELAGESPTQAVSQDSD